MPDTQLILHVKGTESETTELPKHVVRAAISQGKFTDSQLIWSPADNVWKQAREFPDLLPSQELAPVPPRPTVISAPQAVDEIIPDSPVNPIARAVAGTPQVRASTGIPQVRVAAISAGTQPVRVAAAQTLSVQTTPQASASTTRDFSVKEDDSSHPLKWVCIGLGTLIALTLGGNFLLVDQPLVSSLRQTPYSRMTVYAHYGAFLQPNTMVIHIPASPAITAENLTDFLVALAHGTPQNPINRDLFERVVLTSGWTGQYSFSGYSWKQLGDMQDESEAHRKEFLMAQIGDASGQPLIAESNLDEAAQRARRDQAWQTFVANFAPKR
jgi:hypothetical protein